MQLENVNLEEIMPNPLNPRQDYSIDSKQMQDIIKKRGWETGITCYKKDKKYVILSGHRRWYAATQLKEKTVPVFVVRPPKNQLEELERLGSSQSGQVDWSPYEWAKYTFDLWILKDKPSMRELSFMVNASSSITSARIKVFRYFPHGEIEKDLEEGTLSITILSEIIEWIRKLKVKQPKVIEDLGEGLIRANMVKKAKNGAFTGIQLRTDKFMEMAEPEQVVDFIRNTRMKLKDAYKLLSDGDIDVSESKLKRVLNSLEKRKAEIVDMDADSPDDARRLYYELENILENINKKKEEVKTLAEA